nr:MULTISPECIES: metallophosphoesterase [unclassified Luteimonas]
MLLFAQALWAAPRQLDAYRWDNVARIVAIGDLHGDYDSYLTVLQSAGVVDRRGRWIAGDTHLVQTGDIPDRGPDTRRIIAHMARLGGQAEKRGGQVHNLLGNHEAMNVYGDLRYVSAGEYSAFAGKRAPVLRDRYYKATLEALAASDPEQAAALPADHRAQWDLSHPLGWVEHRFAWDPRWDPKGELFLWTMKTKVAIQLNDLVFVHGGIGSTYCGNSLESMTTMARAALGGGDPDAPGILRDEAGPLWYRGLAGVDPAASTETVDAILGRHGAAHVVIGHTPTDGVIWPRLAGRVIMIDTGISAAYGGHVGWLEVTREGLFAGYRGGRLRLPMDDGQRLEYLDAVIALQPANPALPKRREALRAGTLDAPPANVAPTPAQPLEAAAICGTAR